jgi:MFS family permease
LILTIALMASVAASLNLFKVPPIMPLLMGAFHLSESRAGLLMSLFAINGLLLAIPAGFILQKLGARITGLIALSFVIAGAAAGALTESTAIMFFSRFLEGAGMSFIAVVSPALVAAWFTGAQRGKAMGVLAAWVPLGSTLMFLLAPLIASRWQWQGVWWFGCLYAAVVGILYLVFVQSSPQGSQDPESVEERLRPEDIKRALRDRNLWFISILFCCFNYVFNAFVTWTPTFLNEVRGNSLATASLIVSLMTIFAIVSSPIAGWVSDRIGSRKLICVVPMLLMMLLLPFAFSLSAPLFRPYGIVLGLIAGFIPTGVFSAGVEILGDRRLSGMAIAVIMIGQNAGMLLGPFLFGAIVGSMGGWQTAFWMLAPVAALGAVAGWIARMN